MTTIRPATLADVPECEKLAHDPYLRFPTGGYPDAQYLKEYISEHYFLVAEQDGTIVGWILGEPLKSHGAGLWFFIIDEKFRKQGIGTMLYDEFEKHMRAAGREWIFLTSHITNAVAGDFYLKKGFVKGEPHYEMAKNL